MLLICYVIYMNSWTFSSIKSNLNIFFPFCFGKLCSHLSSEDEFESKANLLKDSTKSEDLISFPDQKSPDSMRRGSAGIVGNMMLLNSHQSMHAPFTQVFSKLLFLYIYAYTLQAHMFMYIYVSTPILKSYAPPRLNK